MDHFFIKSKKTYFGGVFYWFTDKPYLLTYQYTDSGEIIDN